VLTIDPLAYDKRHPVVEVDADDEQSGFLGRLVEALSPLAAMIKSGPPVLEVKPLEGEILPPLSPQLSGVIPQHKHGNRGGQSQVPQLPAGVVYPRPAMIFDSVFPGALRGKACCTPLMVRHAGGMVAPAFCGQTCEPGSDVCSAHLPRAVSPQLRTATTAPIRIKARRPIYY
jgi:hypothetical protein